MSAAVWDIFTKFGVPVAMDSPQRAVTSFWCYNKIQDDGGRPPFWIMENRINSAAIWAIFAKFGVVVDMDSLQRAVTTIFDLYKNTRCRPAAILKKGKSPYLSRCFRYLHQIWCALGHWHPAGSPCVIFGLQQNPRWRPAPFWKSGKSQKLDSYLRCLHKFFSKTANIIYKKNYKQFI